MKADIVLIEDHVDMRENIVEILELSNYHVRTAPDGANGVRLIREHIPDLIICDIMMPKLDGYGVLKILNEDPKTASIPFLFLTAKAEKADFRKGMTLGASDYITKPFNDVELLEAIEIRLKKGVQSVDDDVKRLEQFYDQKKALKILLQKTENEQIFKLGKKEILFNEGSHPRFVFQVLKGMVKAYEVNSDGKELITGLYGPGDFVGLQDIFTNEHYTESVQMIQAGEIRQILKSDFLHVLYTHQDVSVYVQQKLALSIASRKNRLLHMAYDSVRRRTADALLWIDEIFNTSKTYPFYISFTRDDLAAIVGTAKESVIRNLTDLKQECVIEVQSGSLIIKDRESLKSIIG